jgi:hypothetical protein
MPSGPMKFHSALAYLYYIINSEEIKKLYSTNSNGNVIENTWSHPSEDKNFCRDQSEQQ